MIIGLSGFARSGKDEMANYLVQKHGFVKLAFADILREVLYQLNPYVVDATGYEHTTLQSVIDDEGWDHYKEGYYGEDIRRLLQRLGTEAGRQTLWETIWIDATLKDLDPDGKYVVSDARFLNEFRAIEQMGGVIIRINRKGIEPPNDHASEMEALQYDFRYIIMNNSDLESYHRKVDEMYSIVSGEFIGCRR